MLRNLKLCCIAIYSTVLIAGAVSRLHAGVPTAFESFQAKFIRTRQGIADSGILFVKKNKIRIESVIDGRKSVLIVRFDKKTVWSLLDESEQYYEMSTKDNKDIPRIVFRESSIRQIREEGTATVQGFACVIVTISYKEAALGTLVHHRSKELKYPLVIEARRGSGVEYREELSSIRVGKQDDALFELPKGYTKFELPGHLDSMMNSL